jgi:hypothetical protein
MDERIESVNSGVNWRISVVRLTAAMICDVGGVKVTGPSTVCVELCFRFRDLVDVYVNLIDRDIPRGRELNCARSRL